METGNLIARIVQGRVDDPIGRIGGNIPALLLGRGEAWEGYDFYASFKRPDREGQYLTVLVPKDYDRMLDGNAYPNCSVMVICHGTSEESGNAGHTIAGLNKAMIAGYDELPSGQCDFITVSAAPALVQDEPCYYEPLHAAGFSFYMQIDEDYYPDDLLSGRYVFGYGALYLYRNDVTGEVVAGFWQYS